MNMWAAYPGFLDCLEDAFIEFLGNGQGDILTKEYLIPVLVDSLLKSGKASVKVLPTEDKWIGITYKEDLEPAQQAFADMIRSGVYPEDLWAL